MKTALQWRTIRVGSGVLPFEFIAMVNGVEVARVRHSPANSARGLWQVIMDGSGTIAECPTRHDAINLADKLFNGTVQLDVAKGLAASPRSNENYFSNITHLPASD